MKVRDTTKCKQDSNDRYFSLHVIISMSCWLQILYYSLLKKYHHFDINENWQPLYNKQLKNQNKNLSHINTTQVLKFWIHTVTTTKKRNIETYVPYLGGASFSTSKWKWKADSGVLVSSATTKFLLKHPQEKLYTLSQHWVTCKCQLRTVNKRERSRILMKKCYQILLCQGTL